EADRAVNAERPAVAQARRTTDTARRKIERHLAALEAGVDPALIAERTRHAQHEIARARAVIDNATDLPDQLTEDEVLAGPRGAAPPTRAARRLRHPTACRCLPLARPRTDLPTGERRRVHQRPGIAQRRGPGACRRGESLHEHTRASKR